MAETLNEVLEIVEATVNDKFEHLQDTNNPHNVTKEQVGLGSVDNTADIDKPVSNATSSAINTLRQEVFSAVTTLEQGTLSAVTTLRNDTFSAINTVQSSLTSATERLENITNEIAELADRLNIQDVREGSIDDLQETGIYHIYNTVTGYPAELFEGLGAVSSCIVKVYRAVSSDSYSVTQEIYLAYLGVIQHSPLGIRVFDGSKWYDWVTKNYTLTELSRFTGVSEAATVTACQTFLAADDLGTNIRRVPLSELQTSGGSTTGIYDLSSLPKATVTLDITTGESDVSDVVAIFKMANTDELDTITTEGKYRLYLKMITPGGENALQIGYMTVTKTGIEKPQTTAVSLQINQIVRLHPNFMYAQMTVLETIPIAAYRYKTQDESGNFSNWSSWQNDELIDYLNFGSIPLPLSKVGQVKENGIIGADTTILIANGDGKGISKIPFDSIRDNIVLSDNTNIDEFLTAGTYQIFLTDTSNGTMPDYSTVQAGMSFLQGVYELKVTKSSDIASSYDCEQVLTIGDAKMPVSFVRTRTKEKTDGLTGAVTPAQWTAWTHLTSHRLAVSSTGQVSDIAFVQCFKADGTAVNIPVADFKAFIKS